MAPPVAGRKINITQLIPVTEKKLFETYVQKGRYSDLSYPCVLMIFVFIFKMGTSVSMADVTIVNLQILLVLKAM